MTTMGWSSLRCGAESRRARSSSIAKRQATGLRTRWLQRHMIITDSPLVRCSFDVSPLGKIIDCSALAEREAPLLDC